MFLILTESCTHDKMNECLLMRLSFWLKTNINKLPLGITKAHTLPVVINATIIIFSHLLYFWYDARDVHNTLSEGTFIPRIVVHSNYLSCVVHIKSFLSSISFALNHAEFLTFTPRHLPPSSNLFGARLSSQIFHICLCGRISSLWRSFSMKNWITR